MRITILGSGTGVPSIDRNAPAYLLETTDRRCLVDCGSGTLRQLLRAGVSYKSVDALFFTHTHPDHIGDLIGLIHALKATPGFRREQPLHLFGPTGFPAFYQQCIAPVATPPKHFEVRVAEAAVHFDFLGTDVHSAATVHSDQVPSVAYRFEQGGRSAVFSGDCDYDEAVIRLARGADVLVVDCSFPDMLKVAGHLSATECGRVAAGAEVKSMILSHLYPVPADLDTRLDEARSGFGGPVRLAEDLMIIDL